MSKEGKVGFSTSAFLSCNHSPRGVGVVNSGTRQVVRSSRSRARLRVLYYTNEFLFRGRSFSIGSVFRGVVTRYLDFYSEFSIPFSSKRGDLDLEVLFRVLWDPPNAFRGNFYGPNAFCVNAGRSGVFRV